MGGPQGLGGTDDGNWKTQAGNSDDTRRTRGNECIEDSEVTRTAITGRVSTFKPLPNN